MNTTGDFYTCPTCDATLPVGEFCIECAEAVEPANAEAIADVMREGFSEVIERATNGDLTANGDETLVIWDGAGFRVTLSDGSVVDVQINVRHYA
jgi:hypothetical protein